ncbi:hypothetical protein FC92_GL001447 [Liquorilactobacillus hordei DSM 19519]|uniref:Uncharacterized protein n=1 Tax=Liquorilactobacillus hordei DSM 19519 TaxID=1423759 RepID=A0A0R1MQ39_9LACO|nr:hypothetical protein FC92_GL001447 [Liquorilactobacillus hordei DSM 19519]
MANREILTILVNLAILKKENIEFTGMIAKRSNMLFLKNNVLSFERYNLTK